MDDRGFVELMREVARGVSLRRGEVTVDDLRRYAKDRGLKPKSPAAWGAIFRTPGWQVLGRRPSAVDSNHGREVRVWRWAR